MLALAFDTSAEKTARQVFSAERSAAPAGGANHARLVAMDEQSPQEEDLTNQPEDLLRAIAETQDRSAFVQLFRTFGPKLKAFMLAKGVGDALAEDLIQEVMLSVWNKAGLYNPEKASVSTWLFTIARNKRIDSIRKNKRLEFDGSDPELVTEPEEQADSIVNATQMAKTVRQALGDLPKEQRQIVHLSFFEEQSHSEIAAKLDLPIGTVKSRVRLAMEKLRAKLGELK